MKLKNITVQLGGFHDHWLRNGSENPTLLMAAMQYYNYDFICLLDKPFGETAKWEKEVVETWMPGKKVFLGIEHMYDWGHVVAVENSCSDLDLASLDWREELKKIHAGGGFVALAHIGYPDLEHQVFKTKELNEIIDNDYTDAVQLEKVIDWEWVKPRTESGKPIPLVGGWDAHMLLNKCDNEPNLYTKSVSPAGHIDSAPGMRTIVFSEDNSLESIKKAIRQGKSVLEHVETGELFGSPELIELLISEGYPELMAEHLKKHGELVLKNDYLTAFQSAKLQFPGKGVVTYPKNTRLDTVTQATDEQGILELDSVPMPTMQEKNYIPVYWKGEKDERFWAVKIFNNVNLKVYPAITDNKRVITVETKYDIDCTIDFRKPLKVLEELSAKAGEKLYTLILPDSAPDIIPCDFSVLLKDGRVLEYKKTFGVAVAKPADTDWADCHVYHANTQEQCGGFGNNRPYPGEDVFSGKGQFKWDEKYLYFRCDIVDAIHIPPPSGHFMYRSDCVCISFDPELTRSKLSSDLIGVIFGFPKEGPEINSKKPEDIPGGAKLFLEETDYGRIVTIHIPWEILKIDNPHRGLLMGVHFSFLNDNGTGLLDNVHWPAPAPSGKMEQPDDFGTLYLE